MNIDERLEALAARHEALAQSMELTHHDIQDLLKTTREHTVQIRDLLQASKSHDSQIEKLLAATIENAKHIAGLARIAQSHKSRIENLEDTRQ